MTLINFQTVKFSKDKAFFDNHGFDDEIAVITVRKEIVVGQAKAVIKAIHPFTLYIIEEHQNNSFKTQMNQLDTIIPFLNYYRKQLISDKEKFIYNLRLTDITNYINDSVINKHWSEGTTKNSIRTLTNFLYYLCRKGFLPNIKLKSFKRIKKANGGTYIKSPFKGIQYKHCLDKPVNRVRHLPYNYLMLLLEVALNRRPRIALGIYIQLFGGLRTGSVINTSRLQVQRRISNGDYRFKYDDRTVRTTLRDLASSGTKFNDEAIVDNVNGVLVELFNFHTSLFKPADGSNALFVNSRGEKMTSTTYRNDFRAVKDAFIGALSQGNIEDQLNADYLRTVSFTPHSLRGIFSNLIAETTDNVAILAYRRRDKNFESSLPYLTQTTRMKETLSHRMEQIHLFSLEFYEMLEDIDHANNPKS